MSFFSVLPDISQTMTQRLKIYYENLAYSLSLFLTNTYNLSYPIYVNLYSITWHFCPSISHFLSPLCVFWHLSHIDIILPPLPFSAWKSHLHLFIAIGHSVFYYNKQQYIFKECANIPHFPL